VTPQTNTRPVRTADSDTSDSSSSGSSSDSDDAPLASLMNPKRPNTSMSNVSTGTAGTARQRTPSKPLIDLNTKANPISGKPEAVDAADSSSPSIRLVSPTNINNRLQQLTAGLAKRRSLSSKSESHLPSGATSSSSSPRPQQSPKRSVQLSDAPMPSTMPSSPNTPVTFPSNPSPNKQGAFTKPIPVKSVTHDNAGFRVVSRPIRNSMDSTPTTPSFSSTTFTQTTVLTSEPEPMKSEETAPKDQIRPRPVRHRPTDSSFSVVSRPTSSVSSNANDGLSDISKALEDRSPRPSPGKSPSSTSRLGAESSPKTQPSSSLSPLVTSPGYSLPQRPFANQRRQDSPASSTGGSSSGKAPLTPRDGSDYFSVDPRSRNDSANTSEASVSVTPSALKGTRNHIKRSSVTFADADISKLEKERGRLVVSSSSKDLSEKSVEERRRERRRSEAKASIEVSI